MLGNLAKFAGLMMGGMLEQNTPEEMTDALQSALKGVGTGESCFLDIEPGVGCLPLNCYGNVATMIVRHGGGQVHGWIVYKGGGDKYLKLVHHAVWQRPDGTIADPTPSDESRNHFIPDSRTQAGAQARYIALEPGPEVDAVIRFCKEMDEMQHDFNERLRSFRDDAVPVVLGRVGRNEPCPCGSGRKSKRCHARLEGGAR